MCDIVLVDWYINFAEHTAIVFVYVCVKNNKQGLHYASNYQLYTVCHNYRNP